ncbi:MAG: hypothetical protein HY000_09650 [Planctomycetes bacterium]|nr:hypothetical protein [Planctomycetota bacterium]
MSTTLRTHGRGRCRTQARNRTRKPYRVEGLEDRTLLSYSFKPIAFLGDTVPGGAIPGVGTAKFTFDFEPGDINNSGQLVFGADMTTGGEGTFFADAGGKLTAMARTGDKAPPPDNAATLGFIFLGVVTLNDAGVAAVAIHRDGFSFPTLFESGSGLYRYSSANHQLNVELLPGAPAPGGGDIHGIGFQPVINNQGTIAFGAIIDATIGPANPPGNPTGLGKGVFTVDASHNVSKIVRPGDPATGGKTFDFGGIPWINDLGDVAFTAHVQEDTCIQFFASFPTGNQIFCAESIYVRDHVSGQIKPVARQGDNAPGGGKFDWAYSQKINNTGQIAFMGSLPARPPGTGHLPLDHNGGVFFNSGGKNIAIARPGDAMPGGGRLVTAGFFTADVSLNNNGLVSFDAVIDSDADGDGRQDTALYTWNQGVLSRVVGSGDVIPGIGTVRALKVPDLLDLPFPFSGTPMNDQGQIAFQATIDDSGGTCEISATCKGVLLVATPPALTLSGTEHRAATEALTALTPDEVRPLVNEALARWEAAGADTSSLGNIEVRITDLPDAYLGLASGHSILLDSNAAGHGWFVDPTPGSDGEFPATGRSLAHGRVDLLTAMTHEVGHLLGFEHSDTDGVMGETLAVSTRRMPVPGHPAVDPAPFDAVLSGEPTYLPADRLLNDLIDSLSRVEKRRELPFLAPSLGDAM